LRNRQNMTNMTKSAIDLPRINLLHIELSNICNFNCDFCPTTVSKRKKQSMDIDLFRDIIDDISENGEVDTIQLHVLGEPLLHKDVFRCIEYASQNGLKVFVTTNGSLLTRETILKIRDNGAYNIDISLQVYDDSGHATRRARIDFDTYRDRVLSAVSTIHHETDLQLIVKMMNTRYKRLFAIDKPIPLQQSGSVFRESVRRLVLDIYAAIGQDIREEEVDQSLRKANLDSALRIRLAENLFVFVQLFMDWGNAFCRRRVYSAPFGACSFAFTAPAVLSDGSVVICCGDYDGKTRIGNVKENPFTEIMKSPLAHDLWEGFARYRLRHPHCRRCLGAPNPFSAWFKGAGSVFVSKFMNLEGENRLIIR